MDIYQIIIMHNRIWTVKEMLCFGGVFLIILAGVIRMVYRQRILKRQVAAVLFLVGFLEIVFGSTVFIGGKFVELRITDADGSAASIHCQPQDKKEVGISDRILCIGGNRGLPGCLIGNVGMRIIERR